MKKTMLALMATVGLAFGAKADVLNSTGFEGLSTFDVTALEYEGDAKQGLYWAVTNTSADLSQTVLTPYGASATPVYVPDAFTNAANSTYLKVDTGADVLYRSVAAATSVDGETGMPLLNAGTAIGKGLYFDANVQFTASDGEPTYDSADKLVVWLKATEGENPTTNLVVTAGVLNGTSGEYDPTPFEIDGTYSADTWYRLTVKAMIDDGLTKFVVYVDDEQLKVGGTAAVFNSLVQTGDNKATLTAVGFQGTGAVDNLVWTTEDPFPPEATYTLALTFEDEEGAITAVTVNGTEYEIDDASLGLNVTFPTATETLTISVDLMGGYAIDGWESAEKVITVSEAVQEGVIALKLTVVADEEPTTVVTPTAAEIESGAIPVTGATTAIKIGAFDVPIEAFNVNAGIATVMAPVVAESKEDAGDAFVIDDENDEVTINVNPVEGLFYGVSADADIDKLARPKALTQFDGTNAAEIFTVSKPGAEKGFFKVYSDVKE